MNKIVFRCDSSFSIGSGHLIRCLNLAKLIEGDIIFICRKLEGSFSEVVTREGYSLIELSEDLNYEVESSMEEINEISPYLKTIAPDLVIVDHYGLGKEWEQNAKRLSKRVVAIDDLDREHCVHAILNQNFYLKQPTKYNADYLFMGPKFCIIKPDFYTTSKCLISSSVKNIMIFFGGSDIHSLTLKMLNIIQRFRGNYNWNLVIGSQNKDLSEIKKLTKEIKNINLHINIDYIPKLMSESDIFIGAGGSTTWERAYLGLPSLVISVANNQKKACDDLHTANIISYLGFYKSISNDELFKSINEFIHNYQLRQQLSKNSLNLQVGSMINSFINYLNSDI
jgi:UDP-2,4-diacetamido-2,4,6-trideoxy-beta-L-altropyranose hydrolase